MNFTLFLPDSLNGAPRYIKELVVRTGQLIRYYFTNGCTKPKTALKITMEQTPELKYFIEVCKVNQQIFGGGRIYAVRQNILDKLVWANKQ